MLSADPPVKLPIHCWIKIVFRVLYCPVYPAERNIPPDKRHEMPTAPVLDLKCFRITLEITCALVIVYF